MRRGSSASQRAAGGEASTTARQVRGPIIIVSTMRSGSTLLRLILDSHEHIAIGPESGFVRGVELVKTLPPWPSGPGWYERLGIDEAEMDQRFAAFMDGIFSDYAAARGKERWGDKTPHNVWHMERLARMFPDAAFVGLVRHPAAVALSLQRRGRRFEDGVRTWRDRNAEMVRVGERLGERFCLLRYEDLVARPEAVLRPLLTFLGEPWSPSVLHHHDIDRTADEPRISDGGTRSDHAIDASRSDRWRAAVGSRELRCVSTTAGTLATLFDYGVGDTAPATWSDPLLDGTALAAHRRRLQVRLPAPSRTGTVADAARRRRAAVRRAVTLARTDPVYAMQRGLERGSRLVRQQGPAR